MKLVPGGTPFYFSFKSPDMRNFFKFFWQPSPFSATQRKPSSVCGFIAHAARTRTTLGADGGSYSNPFFQSFFPFLFFFCPIPALPSPPARRSVGVLFDPPDPGAARPATKIASRLLRWIPSLRRREREGEQTRLRTPCNMVRTLPVLALDAGSSNLTFLGSVAPGVLVVPVPVIAPSYLRENIAWRERELSIPFFMRGSESSA